jgi:hypothetical protein
MKPQPFRAPYPVKTYQPRKRPRFVYRARVKQALTVCGVLVPFIGFDAFGGDIHPGLTLAASLGTLGACCVAFFNLFKL